jgi:colanic acid biosynthesis glycosyl transferase WcaI
MRILVVTAYYYPDGGPAAPLYTTLCEALAQRGHDVKVITAVPHYPSGTVPEVYRGKKFSKTLENGVEVKRVGLPSINRSNLSMRLVQFGFFQLRSTMASIRTQYDVLLTHSPSLEVWLPLAYHAVIRNKPVVYSVHDVYPAVGITLGIFHQKFLIHLVTAMEKFCLHHARRVRILSDSFTPALQKLGVKEEKVTLIYDWADTESIHPLPRENGFASEQGLLDHFVVLYAGNIGLSQGLESILDAAKRLADQSDIYFVFVGEGTGLQDLIEKAKTYHLENVRFIPFQSRERVSEVFASADISIVSLRRDASLGSLPSKTFSIMASERPIIASVDPNSDTSILIQRAGCGVCVEPENPEQIVDAIRTLKRDPQLRLALGKKGRQYVLEHHSPMSAADQFEKLLSQVINENV